MQLLCAHLEQQQGVYRAQSATLGEVTRNRRKNPWNRGKGSLWRQAVTRLTSQGGTQVGP